jgi:hydrocephalus-inducing protein
MFVKIKNKSSIQAEFHAFTKKKPSPFKPIQKHGILKPEEEMNIEVVCNADEATKLLDVLHFVIKEGEDKDVILKAKSVGHTIFWKENLEQINFGVIYTHRSKIHNILIENKGNKSQTLTWAKHEDKKQ